MIEVIDRIISQPTFRALLAKMGECKPSGRQVEGENPSARKSEVVKKEREAVEGEAASTSTESVSKPTKLATKSSASTLTDGRLLVADGLWGSFAPALAGAIAQSLGRPMLYITAHLDQADTARDDLELFYGQTPELLSAFETLPGEGAASDEIAAERIRLCAMLHRMGASGAQAAKSTKATAPEAAAKPMIIVAPVQALMQSVPAPDALAANLLDLSVGQRRDVRRLAEWLVQRGYSRLDQVESPGDFAIRGDILDIFPPAESEPYRIDFFDEVIETIRRFDVSTQRSRGEFHTV
ncbi:MAG: hypothetical protein FWC56_00390, partial [Phycisphaerae bacterium]|nr:hypothetical protein [Phycisphaerae bacterium]